MRGTLGAWKCPTSRVVGCLARCYTPAGASLLGALLSGTNSPSAPVRSSVRRRARGRKGHAWSRKTERRSRSLVEESEDCPVRCDGTASFQLL
ncbi:uncharacterized protein [Equus przewalskii]|uniref:Uncharacterized protein isoform X10 n=1 Tax=Equus przewalskii TaxID=9798 RepID=A0ABM4P9M2_EQUPR